MKPPQHLADIDPTRRTFGTVERSKKAGTWKVEAEPQVIQFIKRLFPGAKTKSGTIEFHVADRATEDLHWLMMRFPLRVAQSSTEQYQAGLNRARLLAQVREGLVRVAPATVIPHLELEPFKWQSTDIAKMVFVKRCLNAWDTGLGKTIGGLAAACLSRSMRTLIVVSPSLMQGQWERMIGAWVSSDLAEEDPTVVAGLGIRKPLVSKLKGTKPHPIPDTPFVVTHYGLLDAWQAQIIEHGFQAVIFDEAHELRKADSKKYLAAHAISRTAECCWGLTATPILNYGEEMHPVMDAISEGCLGTISSFRSEWCMAGDPRRLKKPADFARYLVNEGLMIIRKKTDPEVAMQLPTKRRIMVPVDQDEHLYRTMVREAEALAGKFSTLDFMARGVAVRNIDSWTRKAAGVAKAKAVADFVLALEATGERILVGAHHHEVHDMLALAFGRKCVKITGRETFGEKEAALRRFISGEATICLLAIRAATGIDGIQKQATAAVMAELDWSPQIHKQFEDRILRYGLATENDIPCYYPVGQNSYDSVVREVLGLKVGQFSGLMMDDVGSFAEDPVATSRHFEMLLAALRKTSGEGTLPR